MNKTPERVTKYKMTANWLNLIKKYFFLKFLYYYFIIIIENMLKKIRLKSRLRQQQ